MAEADEKLNASPMLPAIINSGIRLDLFIGLLLLPLIARAWQFQVALKLTSTGIPALPRTVAFHAGCHSLMLFSHSACRLLPPPMHQVHHFFYLSSEAGRRRLRPSTDRLDHLINVVKRWNDQMMRECDESFTNPSSAFHIRCFDIFYSTKRRNKNGTKNCRTVIERWKKLQGHNNGSTSRIKT